VAVERAFARHALAVVDVEELATHGGSLRLYVRHSGAPSAAVRALREKEKRAGLDRPATYLGFFPWALSIREKLLEFLRTQKASGKKVVAYGAAAKGNTLLNYCGVRPDEVAFVADVSSQKRGRLLPGTRIPVVAPERLFEERPDFVLIL